MSKKLLAIMAALSVAGCFVSACDSDDNGCETGTMRCENSVSQICSGGVWVLGGQACGGTAKCSVGTSVCDGTGSVKVCSETGDWLTISCSAIQVGAQCVSTSTNSAGCTSPSCSAGQSQCLNGVSQVCNNGSWVNGGNACETMGCTTGQTQCVNGISQVCVNGQWLVGGNVCGGCTTGQMQCVNGISQVCVNSQWLVGGNACVGCSTGATQCMGGISQICSNGIWVNGGNACGGGACTDGATQCLNGVSQTCSGGVWANGGNACSSSTCTTGATQCLNGKSQVCVAGTWTDGGNACNVVTCTDGATQCLGGTSQLCSGGVWVNGGDACGSGACTDGATQCLNGTSQVCTSGAWVNGGNACSVVVCTDGATQCLNGVSMTCASGSWKTGGNACGGGSCLDGATQCQNGTSQICDNGNWVTGGNACSTVVCTDGTTQCLNDVSYICASGNWMYWSDGDACGNSGCTNGTTRCEHGVSQICSNGTWTNGGNACGSTTEPVAGEPCDENTYEGGCSNDGTRRYYCQAGALVEKTCDSGKTCVAKGNNSSTCEGGETCTKETYQAGCTDNLNGSYCNNKGTVVTVKCTVDKPCVNNNGFIKCDDGGGSNVDLCDENSTKTCQKNCTTDGSTGYYWNGSKLVTVDCSDKNDCIIDSNNHVVCGGSSNVDLCDENSTKACQKNCTTDGSTGYYWNGSKLVTVDCSDKNDCIIDSNNHVVCGGGSEVETCTQETYTAGCSDSQHGSYCNNKGTVVTVTCTGDKICNNNNGYISCVSNSSTEPHAGDPCDTNTYSGGCSSDGTKRYYCQAGALVEKTCGTGTSCVVKGNNSSVCESGSSSETCSKETYTPGCTDNLHGSYCGNKGTVVTVTCTADKPCNNNEGYISCQAVSESCTYGSYEAHCDGDVALFCQYNGTIKKETCNAGQCVSCTDGYTFCNTKGKTCANVEAGVDHSVACTGSKITWGGTDGNCCDVINYMPSCNNLAVTYCSSVGKVKSKSCTVSCSVNESTKEYICKNK